MNSITAANINEKYIILVQHLLYNLTNNEAYLNYNNLVFADGFIGYSLMRITNDFSYNK